MRTRANEIHGGGRLLGPTALGLSAWFALGILPGCYSGTDPGHGGTWGDPSGASSAGGSASGGADSEGEDSDGPDDPTDPDEPTEVTCDGLPLTLSAAPLRRLNRAQYRNTVHDLFEGAPGLEVSMEPLDFVVDGKAGNFASTTTAMDAELVRTFMFVAEDVAAVAVNDSLPGLPVCDWADPACVEGFVADFGGRAFRRPLLPEQMTAYMDLWAQQRDDVDAEAALRTVITALLSSPSFLYLEEPIVESDGELAELDGYALASRLSYFLWESMPDQNLIDAASDGTIGDSDVLTSQVDRMLEDPKFDRALTSFHAQLLRLDDLDNFQSDAPGWSPTMASSMQEEMRRFVTHVFRESEGTISELLAADYTFADAELAALYGVEAPTEPFGRVQLDPQQRAGLLTQVGFLTRTSGLFAEVHRGKFVREGLLCDHMAPPPEGELDPNVERLETLPCSGCHIYLDLIGFGFSDYDSIGAFVPHPEAGSEGEILPMNPGSEGGTFEGARELSEMLAGSPAVETCFAVQWSRFATGRVESKEDECAMEALGEDVAASGGDLRKLLRTIALSSRFRVRRSDAFAD